MELSEHLESLSLRQLMAERQRTPLAHTRASSVSPRKGLHRLLRFPVRLGFNRDSTAASYR